MKRRLIMMCLGLLLLTVSAKAQWTVFDPTNLAQGIVNTTKQIVQTSSTATNMLNNFKETVKIYEQAKGYYDALKSVHNLVKDARKVQQSVLLVGEISDIYVTSFQKMLSDPNFTVDELSAIAGGYAALLQQSTNLIGELRDVVTVTGLSMSDKERMDVVDKVYDKVFRCHNLVRYYTNKNISVSYLRSMKKGDADRMLALYGNPDEKYW